MKSYLVSYTHKCKNNNIGFGDVMIKFDGKLTSERIEELREDLKKGVSVEFGFDPSEVSIILISFTEIEV